MFGSHFATVWREFLWGAVAGGFGEGLMHPIDTIKTRIQSQAIFTGTQVLLYLVWFILFMYVLEENLGSESSNSFNLYGGTASAHTDSRFYTCLPVEPPNDTQYPKSDLRLCTCLPVEPPKDIQNPKPCLFMLTFTCTCCSSIGFTTMCFFDRSFQTINYYTKVHHFVPFRTKQLAPRPVVWMYQEGISDNRSSPL